MRPSALACFKRLDGRFGATGRAPPSPWASASCSWAPRAGWARNPRRFGRRRWPPSWTSSRRLSTTATSPLCSRSSPSPTRRAGGRRDRGPADRLCRRRGPARIATARTGGRGNHPSPRRRPDLQDHRAPGAGRRVPLHPGVGPGGWAVTSARGAGRDRRPRSPSLDPQGFKAEDGLSLKLEDFELRPPSRHHPSTSPASLGPDAPRLRGRGRGADRPQPAAERDELRTTFWRRPLSAKEARSTFIRAHPADLTRVLESQRFDVDPDAASRSPAAQRVYRAQSQRYFVVDAALPKAAVVAPPLGG